MNRFISTTLIAFVIGIGSLGAAALTRSSQVASACSGDLSISGTRSDDVIKGTTGDDVINGRAGNDIICGRGGDDVIKGGRGNDIILGGSGDDVLHGGAGEDLLSGRSGIDSLFGGLGTDDCNGEDETDCEDPKPTVSPSATPSESPTTSPTSTPPPSTPTPTPTGASPPPLFTGPNVTPVATNDSFAATEDQVLAVPRPGVLTNDTDAGRGSLTAQLVSGPASGLLTLNPDGSFTYHPDSNFNGSDSFTYRAQDGGNTSPPATTTLTVSAVPDAPSAASATEVTPEDTPKVVTLTGTDPDGPAPTVFKITSLPTSGDLREGSGLGGHLIVSNDLPYTLSGNTATYVPDANFSGTDSFDFKANDGALDSSVATIGLTVTSVNDPPNNVSLSSNSADEEQAPGATVGNLSLTDPDVGDTQTFTLAAGAGDTDNARFQIVDGVLKTYEVLDFETQGPFSIRVRGADAANAFFEKQFAITLNNINDAPVVTGGTFSLPENSANGTAVGTPGVSDQDAAQTHTWAITGGNTGGAFQIDATTGQITVADANDVDFETNHPFSLTVEATDSGTPSRSDTETITINLTNVNEGPTDISLNDTSVAENASLNTVVGTISGTDPDSAGLVFSLVSGAGDGDNGRFNVGTSNSLRTSDVFDKETQGPFSIRLRATDGGNLQYEEVFSITIDDVNELPEVEASTFGLDENSATGTSVGTVTATDPDGGQSLSWAITAGNVEGAFQIDATTGEITVADASAVDFETNHPFVLTVQATDNGVPPLSDSSPITINLNDLNE